MDYCFLRGFQYSRLDGSMAFADREENVSVQIPLQLCWVVLLFTSNLEMYIEVKQAMTLMDG